MRTPSYKPGYFQGLNIYSALLNNQIIGAQIIRSLKSNIWKAR